MAPFVRLYPPRVLFPKLKDGPDGSFGRADWSERPGEAGRGRMAAAPHYGSGNAAANRTGIARSAPQMTR